MKTCKSCQEYLPLSSFTRQKKGLMGRTSKCKSCMLVYQKEWRVNNPEKAKALAKKSRSKPNAKEVNANRVARWIVNNPDRHKEIRSKSNDKIKEELSDGYIKSLICGNYSSGITFDDIPPELVELWRQQIKIQRAIKNKSND